MKTYEELKAENLVLRFDKERLLEQRDVLELALDQIQDMTSIEEARTTARKALAELENM